MCPSWSECGGYSCINVYVSLEATQLQGSTGVLVSSEHPGLIWTRNLLMIQHVVGMLLRRSFLSWQYVGAAHFYG